MEKCCRDARGLDDSDELDDGDFHVRVLCVGSPDAKAERQGITAEREYFSAQPVADARKKGKSGFTTTFRAFFFRSVSIEKRRCSNSREVNPPCLQASLPS
jgi:hypothetical protein